MMKILIATTNEGKFKEIKSFLGDLPVKLVSLGDVGTKYKEPAEDQPTLEGNAILKAKYYAEKTGLISLADDGGLFVDALKAWPGVKSARIADSKSRRNELVLGKLKGKTWKKRTARFRAVLAIYDPKTKDLYLTNGETAGHILEKAIDSDNGFGYDPIFYVDEKKKAYVEMSVVEKNSCSHRGKALAQMKYFLRKQFGSRHIVVPLAIIIKDGKALIAKRNDPHNKKFHGTWEFPGGAVEYGETIIMEIKWINPGEYSKFKLIFKNNELFKSIIGDLVGIIEKYKL
ncbi:MAG: RdgB/HAM1 family non-canonical purine NTP pyrophosphatase [Candidatus Magasanikbacteria bacterium]|nr:RdgB/HAM1 family non-canonical purine NTP pyrophosphatase [Candidatus Magasanikbacteria bacterium]